MAQLQLGSTTNKGQATSLLVMVYKELTPQSVVLHYYFGIDLLGAPFRRYTSVFYAIVLTIAALSACQILRPCRDRSWASPAQSEEERHSFLDGQREGLPAERSGRMGHSPVFGNGTDIAP